MTQLNKPLPGSSPFDSQTGQPALPLSRRPVVLGVLNLLFAVVYLLLGLNAAKAIDTVNQLPSSIRSSVLTAAYLDVLADLLVSAGLFVGGFLLLMHRRAGRQLTRAAAIVGGLMIAYTIVFFLTVGNRMSGASLIGSMIGITLRFIYPIIATRLFDTSRLELGLT